MSTARGHSAAAALLDRWLHIHNCRTSGGALAGFETLSDADTSDPLQSRHAVVPAREDRPRRAQTRARLIPARARALPLAATYRPNAHILARPVHAARAAVATGAGR